MANSEPSHKRPEFKLQLARGSVLVTRAFTWCRSMRINNPLGIAANITLIVGNRRLQNRARSKRGAFRGPAFVSRLAPVFKQDIRLGFLRRARRFLHRAG